MDKKTKNMTRMVIYVAAGIYLVCLAYRLYAGLPEAEGLSHALGLASMVVFGLGGAAMAVFGVWQLIVLVKKGVDEMEQETPENETEKQKKENS